MNAHDTGPVPAGAPDLSPPAAAPPGPGAAPFCYTPPGDGADPFDLAPAYHPAAQGPPPGARVAWQSVAAGFAPAALRREVWPASYWSGLQRRRTLPPACAGTSSLEQFAARFEQAVARAAGEAPTLAVTVSGGVDSAAVLWAASAFAARAGRRVVAVSLDLPDDYGGSAAERARGVLDALGLQVELHVAPADPARWPEPEWCWHGPRLDAWPRYRFAIAQTAADAGAGVLLHGTGADELLTAPPHLAAALRRVQGSAAARRYRAARREREHSELDRLASAVFARRPAARTGGPYWAVSWPNLTRPIPHTLTAPMRAAAAGWAQTHRSESLRAAGQHADWAQAAAMHALFPRDLLTPAGPLPERFPFLDPAFARYAYHLPLTARVGHRYPTAYLNHKHLVARLLPDRVLAALPHRRLSAYRAYNAYWRRVPQAAPLGSQAGLLAPDWSEQCQDAFDRALVLSTEAWLRGAERPGGAR